MTHDELQTAIRSLEGRWKVARDHQAFHEERAGFHSGKALEAAQDAMRCAVALDALREAAA